MKLGYLTNFSQDHVDRAKRVGFDCLEVHSGSWAPNVYGDKSQRQKALDDMKRAKETAGVSVSSIAHYGQAITQKGKQLIEEFERAIDLAQACGAGVVSAIPGKDDPAKNAADNIPAFKSSYTTIAKMAEDKGVKIAFENWPSFGGYPLSNRTMSYTPQIWQMLFDAVPSKALGLEFDPSHLYWQGIDHMAALRKFADRVYHVHAKDTEIFYEKRNSVGIYGDGWWTYVIPGLGEIKWPEFIAGLHNIGFTGGVCIEHEDNRFAAWGENRDMNKFEQGLRIGYATLKPLIG